MVQMLHIKRMRSTFMFILLIFFSSTLVLYYKNYRSVIILPPIINHLRPNNFSSLYENIVLLSCSSDSFVATYCYYLPYVALGWRRIGFEPFIFLVGSEEVFESMPLMNLLRNELEIKYQFVNADSSRSISASQIVRLFGGFISYQYNTTKELFIIVSDVDLLPISRHRFEVDTNDTNYILAVNAYCCADDKFSYKNYHDIHYYPMSYIGMRKKLWEKLFLPLNDCKISSNITIDMIECCLKEKLNETIPRNVIRGNAQWDVDQRFLSLLIVQTEHLHKTYIDKRKLGYRLDPDKNILLDEFDSILLYDDVHLPKTDENILFNDKTWLVLSQAFSVLFHHNIIQLLSRYHHETAASVLSKIKTSTTRL